MLREGRFQKQLLCAAIVEILPGKEGLLHVSEIAWEKTEKVEDVLTVGQEVDVKLLEIDAKTGKMRLSMRALVEKPEGYVEPERKPRPQGGDRDRRNGGNDRRGGDRDRRNGGNDRRGGNNDRRNGGEHRNENRGPRKSYQQEAPAEEPVAEPVENEMF